MAIYSCPLCDYEIDTSVGDKDEGFPAGMDWESDVPDDWFCPDCGVRDKDDFTAAS